MVDLLRPRIARGFYPARYADFAFFHAATSLSGDPATWSSEGGASYTLTQGTAADRGTYSASGWLPGTPAVTFDATGDHLDSDFASSAQSFTVYSTHNQTDGGQQFIFSARNSTSSKQLICLARNGSTGNVSMWDNGDAFVDFGALQTGRQVLAWVFDADASTCTLYRNGAQAGSAVAYSPIASFDQLVIGGWAAGGGQLLNADLFAIGCYTSAHHAATVAEISAHLERLAPIPSRMPCLAVLGQSNAAASIRDGGTEPTEYDAAQTLTWDTAHALADSGTNGNTPPGIGLLAGAYAWKWGAYLNERVYVVGKPQDGASAALCNVGSSNHNDLLARIAAAGVTPTRFLYHQGETDAINSVPQATYQAVLQNIVDDARTRWPGVVVFIFQTAETGPVWNASQGGEIRAAQAAVAAGTADTYLVDVDHVARSSDGIHYTVIGSDASASAAMTVA